MRNGEYAFKALKIAGNNPKLVRKRIGKVAIFCYFFLIFLDSQWRLMVFPHILAIFYQKAVTLLPYSP
jgi:hypothetical protein